MRKAKVDREKIDALIQKGMHPQEAVQEVQTVEIMPGVRADKDNVSWFVNRMFNPEDNVWVWLRRIANILTIPMLIFIVLQFFM